MCVLGSSRDGIRQVRSEIGHMCLYLLAWICAEDTTVSKHTCVCNKMNVRLLPLKQLKG